MRAAKLSPRPKRAALELTDWVSRLEPGVPLDPLDLTHGQGLARTVDLALRERRSPRQSRATGRSREERKAEEQEADAEVYKAVKRRDRGCTVQLPESIVGPCSGPLQIDHQWGRGKEETRVENCRRLCEAHHRRKTDSKPNRVVWLHDYGEHALSCADRGLGALYFDEVDRAGRMAQFEKAQHPGRDAGSGSEGTR